MTETTPRPVNGISAQAGMPFKFRLDSPFQIFKQAGRFYRISSFELIAITSAGYILLLLLALVFNLVYQLLLNTQDQVLVTMFLALGAAGGIITLLGIHMTVTAAVALTITSKLLRSPFSIINTYRSVLQRWDSLLAALGVLLAIFSAIIVMAGIPLLGWLVAPGLLLFFGGLLSLIPAIIMVEGMPGTWAVARAWGLARQHIYRTTGVMALLGVVGALLLAIPSAMMWAIGLPFQVTDIWLPLLLGVFYSPYYATGAVLVYLDLRLRSEEFSPAELAQNLSNGVLPSTPFTLATIYASKGRRGLITVGELGKFAIVSLVVIIISVGLGTGILSLVDTVEPDLNPAVMAEYIGTEAPNFTLEALNGEQITLNNLRGKPTVINFWATWCPPCEKELPVLETAFTDHQDEVNFLTISVEETKETVRLFVEERGLNLPVLLDTDGDVVDRYEVKALPTTLFVDAGGIIVNQHFGALDDAGLEDYLTELTR